MSLVPVAPARAAVLAALGCLLAACPALAQIPPAPAAGAPDEPAPATGPLRVWVDAQDLPLDVAALQATLSKELGREVVLASDPAAADVLIRLESAERAKVRYTPPGGEQLTRDVKLPPDRERSLQVLSWLTVNLVRDEASELLDALRARRKLEADARAAEQRAAEEQAAQTRAAAEKAARDKAAEKAAAEAARKRAASAAAKPGAEDELLRNRLKSFDVALATPISLLPDSSKRELRLQLALAYGDAGAIKGVAASIGALRIRQDLLGAASAMGFVIVGRNATGFVGGMGYTSVEGRLVGAELAGGVNVAGDLTGIQMAAGVNVARDLNGISLGVVNVQRRVRGLQIGIINVAEEVDGGAIGVISLAKNGRLQPVLWGSNGGSGHVALKSIAGYAFTQLGVGMSLDRNLLIYDAGLGAHLRVGKRFFLEPGVHYTSTHETTPLSETPDRYYVSYLAMCGLRFGDALDVLAGAGLRHTAEGAIDEPDIRPEVRVGIGFF